MASIHARDIRLICSIIIALVLVAFFVTVLGKIGSLETQLLPSEHDGVLYSQVVRDVETSSKTTTFFEHPEYKDLGHDYDFYWENLRPPNGGYLARPGQDGLRKLDGISMFHQLHCLEMLRKAVQQFDAEIAALKANHTLPRRVVEDSREDAEHQGHSSFDERHWMHCFDYLRQV
jgi:hypothetical protein